MWVLETLGIPFNAADGTIAIPYWGAGIALALIVILFVLALVRTGTAGTLVFLAVLGFGGWAAWSWIVHERAVERRTFAARLAALDAQALAPGSALGCLNGPGAGALDAACEAAVFASGEATAGAVAYTAARLNLLDEALAFARERDPEFDVQLDSLRRGLEQDRFGIAAHVLGSRPDCTAERCEAMRLFQDAERLRANLRDKVFDTHVARAAPKWQAGPVAQAPAPRAEPAKEQASAPGAPLPPDYNLPSSNSIPPVSIMTAEPQQQPQPQPQPATAPTPPPRPARQQRPPQRRPAQARPAQARPAQTTGEQPAGLPPPPRVQ